MNKEKLYKKAQDLIFENQYSSAYKILNKIPDDYKFVSFYKGICKMTPKLSPSIIDHKKIVKETYREFRKRMPKYIDTYEENPNEESMYIIGSLYTNINMGKYYNFEEGLSLLKRAAKKGNAKAQDLYAKLLQEKVVTRQDLINNEKVNYYKSAIINYEKAAKQGFGLAYYHLAECYWYGHMGLEINQPIAMKYYKEGAKHRVFVCNTDIAQRILYDPKAVNKEEAFNYLIIASKNKYARADRFLAICYYNGYGCERDINAAIKYAKRSAKVGHVQSNLVLYNIYSELGKINTAKKYAKEYYKGLITLNKNNHMRKFYYEHLASCFANGVGTKKNIPKAIEYYKKGAGEPYNYTLCANKLSNLYLDSSSEYYNLDEGIKYLLFSANKKDPWAICRIAEVYQELDDLDSAKNYYRIGVEENVPEASYHLGLIYAESGKHDREAIDLLKNAYDAGVTQAYLPLQALNNKYLMDTNSNDINLNNLRQVLEISKDAMFNSQTIEAIKTAIIIYEQLKEYEYNIGEEIDYSPVITLLSKAIEIEFNKYFKVGYTKYLIDKNADPKDYTHAFGLIRMKSSKKYVFDIEGNKKFTLGDIIHCFDISMPEKVELESINKKYSIPVANDETYRVTFRTNTIVDYFDMIFKNDAFEFANRRSLLLKYLYDLRNDLNFLKNFLRNYAVHSSCMNICDADLAINLILISKRMIFSFEDKIKDSYK